MASSLEDSLSEDSAEYQVEKVGLPQAYAFEPCIAAGVDDLQLSSDDSDWE